ncbi:MAG TPA: MgtC/SapB family protein [Acidimicrobiia bacterium]|nr:MgtC/SapB family protein [Acidimicrobiia bacterium]
MKAELLQLDNSIMVLRVLLAVGLGAALGLEREIDNQPAGFRTHILVCLGAALFGLISIHAFAPFEATRNSTDVQIDITRVASQVVVGVGFLGGGAILKYGASIRGLTTAASMWVAAAIGLAVGLGYYWAAVAVTLAALVSLTGFRPLRAWVRHRYGRRVETVSFRLERGVDAAGVVAALNDLAGVNVRNLQIDSSGEQTEITVGVKTQMGVPLERMLGELAERDDVAEMSYEER